MSNKKIWFITGAGRGMGVDFAYFEELAMSVLRGVRL